jgi:hypothetical protein
MEAPEEKGTRVRVRVDDVGAARFAAFAVGPASGASGENGWVR